MCLPLPRLPVVYLAGNKKGRQGIPTGLDDSAVMRGRAYAFPPLISVSFGLWCAWGSIPR